MSDPWHSRQPLEWQFDIWYIKKQHLLEKNFNMINKADLKNMTTLKQTRPLVILQT